MARCQSRCSGEGRGNQTTQQYEVDVAGATTSYTHDANGNLTSDGTKTYEWNALDQLVRVTQGGSEIASFVYDGLGRRTQKTAGGVTRTYIYDAEDIVEERASSGDVIRYVHGSGIDNVLARTTNGANPIGYLSDHLGSIVQETDAGGQIVRTREYDPWGILIQSVDSSGYAYSGREWDHEIGMQYHRARYYSPDSGRFISSDPAGLIDGPNTYRYTRNIPTILVDLDGRNPLAGAIGGAEIGAWFGAPGGAVGSLIGSVVGGVVGGIATALLAVELREIFSKKSSDGQDKRMTDWEVERDPSRVLWKLKMA